MSPDLSKLRKNYDSGILNEANLITDPYRQFESWFHDALTYGEAEANAMILSTLSGVQPSSRVVLLKEFSVKGFVFYTNYKSRKGKEIAENPFVSLLFFWPQLQRQVRIEGRISKISEEDSDRYFYSRPLEHQAGAIVSKQSRLLNNYESWMNDFDRILKSDPLTRPSHWGGYSVAPHTFEFWQGRPGRLHDRFRFAKTKKNWKIQRLQP